MVFRRTNSNPTLTPLYCDGEGQARVSGIGERPAGGIALILSLILLATLLPVYAQSSALDSLPPCGFSTDGISVGAVIIHLTRNSGCVENLDTTFPVASVPKLFILGAYLEAVAYDVESFNTPVTFSANYLMGGQNACLTEETVGTTYTLGALSELMISCSDNSATWILYDRLGAITIQDYIDRQGIAGIGTVLPYSHVDHLKLMTLDDRWADVPINLASQFYRTRQPNGLSPRYFDTPPSLEGDVFRQANINYYAKYGYNTLTPRAMAEYLLLMRSRLRSSDPREAQYATWFFNTLLLTQRQYSTQAFPGTVFIGAKNGWDFGLWAEVSTIHESLDSRAPDALVIIFSRQPDLTIDEVQRPSQRDGILNRYLRDLSPQIAKMLYPGTRPSRIPTVSSVSVAALGPEFSLQPCWTDYLNSGRTALIELESCWRNIGQVSTREVIALGIVLRNLQQRDTRLTFMFTAPDGGLFSYQTQRFGLDETAIYWFHPADMPGLWTVDIYHNLQRVWSGQVVVLAR